MIEGSDSYNFIRIPGQDTSPPGPQGMWGIGQGLYNQPPECANTRVLPIVTKEPWQGAFIKRNWTAQVPRDLGSV